MTLSTSYANALTRAITFGVYDKVVALGPGLFSIPSKRPTGESYTLETEAVTVGNKRYARVKSCTCKGSVGHEVCYHRAGLYILLLAIGAAKPLDASEPLYAATMAAAQKAKPHALEVAQTLVDFARKAPVPLAVLPGEQITPKAAPQAIVKEARTPPAAYGPTKRVPLV